MPITYADKVTSVVSPLPPEGKLSADDANMIKVVVNQIEADLAALTALLEDALEDIMGGGA